MDKGQKKLTIRGITFGGGIPEAFQEIRLREDGNPVAVPVPICVSVMATTEVLLYEEMKQLVLEKPDMIEWRIDFYGELEALCSSREAFVRVLRNIREIIGDRVLLVTYRTKQEGGMGEYPEEAYERICQCFLLWGKDGLVDLLDIEYMQAGRLGELLECRDNHTPKIVMSFHNFNETPGEEELHSLLTGMEKKGADICKLAVMPRSEEDVNRVLYMTKQLQREYRGQILLMTISMGELGVKSRIYGGAYGSCFTFASAGEKASSAPGQIPIGLLRKKLAEGMRQQPYL